MHHAPPEQPTRLLLRTGIINIRLKYAMISVVQGVLDLLVSESGCQKIYSDLEIGGTGKIGGGDLLKD